jgi:hypothetical protein
MHRKNLLGLISESVHDELRLCIAYLTAENRMLRQQMSGRVQLSDNDRKALGEIGRQLDHKALAEIATVAQPDTILACSRKCAEQHVHATKPPQSVGRPRVERAIEQLVVRLAREHRSWGYDRMQGALQHLGDRISDQTVGNIRKRHGIPPAPERTKTMTWREFIRLPIDVLGATDFLTSEVWSCLGAVSSSLFFCMSCGRRNGHGADTTSSDFCLSNNKARSIRYLQHII